MKFTPNEDFLHGHLTLEAGNQYDSEKQGISDADVRTFHSNGWAEVEGLDPAPPRQTRGAVIQPDSARHEQQAEDVNDG